MCKEARYSTGVQMDVPSGYCQGTKGMVASIGGSV